MIRKLALMRRGLRQRDLARRWRVTESFVSQLVHGKCRPVEYERLFAKVVGMPRRVLFPVSEEASDEKRERVAVGA